MLNSMWSSSLLLVATVLVGSSGQSHQVGAKWGLRPPQSVLALVNITYLLPDGSQRLETGLELGRFWHGGLVTSAAGQLQLVDTAAGRRSCRSNWQLQPPPQQPWIALVDHRECTRRVKALNAMRNNATAVIIYGGDELATRTSLLSDSVRVVHTVALLVQQGQGEDLIAMMASGDSITMHIVPGKTVNYASTALNKTSVVFVSVSFILLMVVSLAWLLFYYVQRFRYLHARDRIVKRLVYSAKKAVTKIPVVTLTADDERLSEGECCAVCLETYSVSEVIRILPCNHEFHRSCVDPWLLRNRTCPMCKLDILRHYGLEYVSSESILHIEASSMGNRQMSPSSSEVMPRQVAGVGTADRQVNTATVTAVIQTPYLYHSSGGGGGPAHMLDSWVSLRDGSAAVVVAARETAQVVSAAVRRHSQRCQLTRSSQQLENAVAMDPAARPSSSRSCPTLNNAIEVAPIGVDRSADVAAIAQVHKSADAVANALPPESPS